MKIHDYYGMKYTGIALCQIIILVKNYLRLLNVFHVFLSFHMGRSRILKKTAFACITKFVLAVTVFATVVTQVTHWQFRSALGTFVVHSGIIDEFGPCLDTIAAATNDHRIIIIAEK